MVSPRSVLAVAALVLVAGCTAIPTVSSGHAARPAPSSSSDDRVLVIYELVGDAKHATIVARTPSGHDETLGGSTFEPPLKAPSGAKYKGPGLRYRFHRGDYVEIMAASVGKGRSGIGAKGSVTCRIRAAKVVVDEETAGPDDLPATCRGYVPFHDGVPLTVP